MKINADDAKKILIEEAELEVTSAIDPAWKEHIEAISLICEGTSKTHIAFLGTALLAKSVDTGCDAFAVKAGDGSSGAYSARGLAHGVLVPCAMKLDINLGVTGREPLNNQPYFRIKRISRDIPVRGNAQIAINSLIDLLTRINEFKSSNEARLALRAFIHVRRKYTPIYATLREDLKALSPYEMSELIAGFVSENSEGGKRAQAIVAGLLDLFAGPDRVMSGRINDPDRNLPGDVGIRSRVNPNEWEKVFEVRDKVVSDEDVYLFIQKAIENGVREAAVFCAHVSQGKLNTKEISLWARDRNIAISFYLGWLNFIEQIAFWSEVPQVDNLQTLPGLIHSRLVEIEVSKEAIDMWASFFN